MLVTGYLNVRELDYPIFRGNLIKQLKDLPEQLRKEVEHFIIDYQKIHRKNAPICSEICENYLIHNHSRKSYLCYGFYKVSGLIWSKHTWICIDGIMIDLRAVYENYFHMNSSAYTDLKLCFTLGWFEGEYKYDMTEMDYLEKNQDNINRNLSFDKLKNLRVELHDAPVDVKSSFNRLVQYFASTNPNEGRIKALETKIATLDKSIEAAKKKVDEAKDGLDRLKLIRNKTKELIANLKS